jgi:hypothetical protein
MPQFRLTAPSRFGGYKDWSSVIAATDMVSARKHVNHNYADPSSVTITEISPDDDAPLTPAEAYRVVRDLIDPDVIGPVENSALLVLYDLVRAGINRWEAGNTP